MRSTPICACPSWSRASSPCGKRTPSRVAEFAVAAALLDQVLSGRDWLVGSDVSYADFRVATVLPFADLAGLPLAD